MQAIGIAVLLVALNSLFWDRVSSQTTLVGTISVANAGLLNIYTHDASAPDQYSVLAATYDTTRNSYDYALVLLYPGRTMANNFTGMTTALISNVLYWPKEIRQVPDGIFDFPALSIGDGSLISGKTAGTVSISDVSDIDFPATYDILHPVIPQSFMYTNVIWKTVDGGGRDDIITCRVEIDGTTVTLAQLIWLEHPTINELTNAWNVGVLKESACDTNLAETTLGAGLQNYDVIYTTGLYTKKLSFFWSTNTFNNWNDPNDIQGEIIESGREYYDVQLVDVNNDGRVDVLATIVSATSGSVEVWQIPEDFRDFNLYTRYVIKTGFVPRNGGAEGRAPGIIRAFHPAGNQGVKPYLLLTGADDGRMYYLQPVSESPTDWTYELITIADEGAGQTVSGATVADVDGDGYQEVFVSVHNKNKVDVYTFKPATSN